MTTNNSQQSQAGPIAQQLSNIQTNGQQTVIPHLNTQPPRTLKGKWGMSDKTVWDWLQLLIIPLILAVGGFWFSAQQSAISLQSSDRQPNSDQAIALEQQHAAILQTYMDNIQDLLLHNNLGKSKPTDDVAILARARTLTAVRGLDADRKGLLIQFLYEAHLIGFIDNESRPQPAIITLNDAFLFDANLEFTYLSGINLTGAIFQDANLRLADLSYSTMGCIILGSPAGDHGIEQCTLFDDANLTEINLSEANIGGTDFIGANLTHAILSKTNLRDEFSNLSQQQLDQVQSCRGALLPKGLVCHNNS